MKCSVIYCTARHGGLDILQRSMEHQTHKDLEVLVLDELHRKSGFIDVVPPLKKPNMFWNLSASLNEGCRRATGDLIVLLQDYIYVPADGIEKYVRRIEQQGKCLISGVSDQYEMPNTIDYPNGLHSVWAQWPGEPYGERCFVDPRKKDYAGFFVTMPLHWEANWGCFPKQAWLDIGGFDEAFDAGWGSDNNNFAERCQLAGYSIFLDTYNEVKCYSHINLFKEQEHRDKSPNNNRLWHDKYRAMYKLKQSYKLNYHLAEDERNLLLKAQ